MNVDEMFREGIKLRNDGQLDEAIEVFHSIMNLFPRDAKGVTIYVVLAGMYHDKEDYEHAREYFSLAVSLHPNVEVASLGLYLALADLEEDEDAVLEMKRYLDGNPAKLYLTTLQELLDGLKEGYMTDYRELIEGLARRNGLL